MSVKASYCNIEYFNAVKDSLIDAFKTEYDDKMRELTAPVTGALSTESVSRLIDEAEARFSLDDWLADPSLKMCNVQHANAAMRTWTVLRNAKVARTLGPSSADAGAPDGDAPAPNPPGPPIDWTRCNGGIQASVSADDFCTQYQRTCGFANPDGGADDIRYASKAACLSAYRASSRQSCLAGQLCYAINFVNRNYMYCPAATGFEPCAP